MATLKENISVLPLHTESLCKYLNVMRQDGKFCDISIKCKDKKFLAHKNILAANSDHFINLFTNGNGVDSVNNIELNIDPNVMEILLEFIYTGKAHMVRDMIEDVMHAANQLKLITIFSHCRASLLECLNVSNYSKIWDIGEIYDDELLKKRAMLFAVKNFNKIFQGTHFLQLSLSQMKLLLCHEPVIDSSQDKIMESVIEWIKHDRLERIQSMPTLLTYVKFEHLSKPYLQILVDQEEIVWECPELMRYITKTVFARYIQGESELATSPVDGGNSLETVAEIETETAIAVFAENDDKYITCQCYSIEQKEWQPPEELPLQMTNSSVVIYDGTIYLIGGKQRDKYLKSIYHYKITTGELLEGHNMHIARSHVGVAECKGFLYVVGGYNASGFLASVECYDPVENEWRQVAPLSEGRGGVGVASVSRFLYVVGGRTAVSTSPLTNVECYDTLYNQWTKIVSLPHPRSHCGMSVLGQKIYVVGGYAKDGLSSSSMLSYDPVTKCWSEMSAPPTEDWVTDAVAWENRMYVLTDAGQIFSYDPVKATWSNSSTGLPEPAYYIAAVLVRKPAVDA